jgi:molybdopterin-guanine dinucleotide biosynthesis protein A
VSESAAPPLGLALAGGRSERMGRDKALLPWPDADLLGHAIARLLSATRDVAVLSGKEVRYADRGRPVLTDHDAGDGPVAGLVSGLEHAGGRAVLLLAVDLPLVPVALLRALVSLLPDADAVVPVSPLGPEPLCAAYGPSCLDAVRARLGRGERKMTAFWPDVRVLRVAPPDLERFGDPETMFLNVNEPGDLERALGLAGRPRT